LSRNSVQHCAYDSMTKISNQNISSYQST